MQDIATILFKFKEILNFIEIPHSHYPGFGLSLVCSLFWSILFVCDFLSLILRYWEGSGEHQEQFQVSHDCELLILAN